MFSPEQNAALGADLDRRHVKPPAPGRFGSYIESWHAIAEANRIFGFDGWSSETVMLNPVVTVEATWERWAKGQRGVKETVKGWDVAYLAKVRIVVGGVVREGTGAGTGRDQSLGLAHESAAKEAESDARKRALMTFGNQFGLALYDKEQRNVSDDDADDQSRRPAPLAIPARGANKEPQPARQIAPVPADAERTAPATPHPTVARDASRHLASTLIGKADLTYTGLVGGVGNIPLLRKQFIAWETTARQQKPQITAIDWSSVQKAREKVIGALKEIDEALERKAAKADAIKAPSAKTEDVIDPETGELGEAA